MAKIKKEDKVTKPRKRATCQTCAKSMLSTNLSRHMKTVHGKRKILPCATCGKNYSRADNLHAHLKEEGHEACTMTSEVMYDPRKESFVMRKFKKNFETIPVAR